MRRLSQFSSELNRHVSAEALAEISQVQCCIAVPTRCPRITHVCGVLVMAHESAGVCMLPGALVWCMFVVCFLCCY